MALGEVTRPLLPVAPQRYPVGRRRVKEVIQYTDTIPTSAGAAGCSTGCYWNVPESGPNTSITYFIQGPTGASMPRMTLYGSLSSPSVTPSGRVWVPLVGFDATGGSGTAKVAAAPTPDRVVVPAFPAMTYRIKVSSVGQVTERTTVQLIMAVGDRI